MIHVVTCHFETDVWIDVQNRYLRLHTTEPLLVWGSLTGIAAHTPWEHTFTLPEREHATKLNYLADRICEIADPDDLIVFLDSDAFPIAPWTGFIREKLKDHSFVAVKRSEMLGTPHLHPLFTVCTVRTWKDVEGDWSRGYRWRLSNGQLATDTGGNLYKTILDHNLKWYPLLRTNTYNPHPLHFGVYGNLIYHHGAGSRQKDTKLDRHLLKKELGVDVSGELAQKIITERYGLIENQTFEKLQQDTNFFLELIDNTIKS